MTESVTHPDANVRTYARTQRAALEIIAVRVEHSKKHARVLEQRPNVNVPTTHPNALLSNSPGRATKRRNSPKFIDVYLSTVPVQRVCCNVPWSAFVHRRISKNVKKYIALRPDKTKCLVLPASDCDPIGVRTAISWLVQAYVENSIEIGPEYPDRDVLNLCCTQRALQVFGLERQQDYIRDYIELECLPNQLSASILRPVWDRMPKGTLWSDRVLDCVQDGLQHMSEFANHYGRCYCESQGPKYETHEDCLGAWLVTDRSLREALGPYRNSRGPTIHTTFGGCHLSDKERTSEWVMGIEDSEDIVPHDQAPQPFSEDVHRTVAVKEQFCLCDSSYRLEWIDEDGGYYLESFAAPDYTPSHKNLTQITSVSREWLTSRGHRGGGQSFSTWFSEHSDEGQKSRRQLFENLGIEPKDHRCVDWLENDEHMVCVFAGVPLLRPQPQRPQLPMDLHAWSHFPPAGDDFWSSPDDPDDTHTGPLVW